MGNKAFILFKAQFINTYGLKRIAQGKGKDLAKRVGLSLVMGASLLYLAALMFVTFLNLGSELGKTGDLGLLLAVAAVGVSAFVFLMSVMKSSSFLFSFKDYDLLMSLPVREGDVMLSKVLLFFVSNLLVSSFIYIPAVVSYGVVSGASAPFYILAALLYPLVAVIPIAAGSILSFPLAYAASKFKAENALMMIGSIGLIIGVMAAQRYMSSGAQAVESVGMVKAVTGFYYPAELFTEAMEGSMPALALFAGGSLLILELFLVVFGRLFKRINGLMTEKHLSSAYRMTELAVSSKVLALYKKELKTYFSSYTYVLNTAMGVIMFTVYTGALLIFDYETVMAALELPGTATLILPVTLMIAAACGGISATTAPSISMEGRSIWIPKSLPLSFAEIAKGKLLVSLTVTIPVMLIDTAVLSFAMRFSFADWLLLAAVIIAVSVFASLVGLVCNLHFPKLDWKSQVHAVKQSFSVFIAVFINMLVPVVPFVLFLALELDNLYLFAAFFSVCLAAASYALWVYLKASGAKLFYML